jgi:hypothetical protein
MKANTYLLLHDVENRECLIPTDFMVAVRGQIERDTVPGDTVGNVTDIKRGKTKVDITVVYIHDSFHLPVLETPSEIQAMLEELNYVATYEPESVEENPDPDEPEEAANYEEMCDMPA